ncbi:MAG TPA: hypothetical protein VFQ54_00190, partial [Thermomicrobiales bacterium]|nr:hypothetical protein [Thermomicrobiales bacterium]
MCQYGTNHQTASSLGVGRDLANRRSTAFDRRVVLKATAGLAAMSAMGGVSVASGATSVAAQEAGGTRASRWTPEPSVDAKAGPDGDAGSDGFRDFETDFPFYALGASWDQSVGLWPVIAVQVSSDGDSWSDTFQLVADAEDGGQPTRDNRIFTPLIFTDGVSWVRFQALD